MNDDLKPYELLAFESIVTSSLNTVAPVIFGLLQDLINRHGERERLETQNNLLGIAAAMAQEEDGWTVAGIMQEIVADKWQSKQLVGWLRSLNQDVHDHARRAVILLAADQMSGRVDRLFSRKAMALLTGRGPDELNALARVAFKIIDIDHPGKRNRDLTKHKKHFFGDVPALQAIADLELVAKPLSFNCSAINTIASFCVPLERYLDLLG